MRHEEPHFGTADHGEQVCKCLCKACYDPRGEQPGADARCLCKQCDCHDVDDPSVDLHYEASA